MCPSTVQRTQNRRIEIDLATLGSHGALIYQCGFFLALVFQNFLANAVFFYSPITPLFKWIWTAVKKQRGEALQFNILNCCHRYIVHFPARHILPWNVIQFTKYASSLKKSSQASRSQRRGPNLSSSFIRQRETKPDSTMSPNKYEDGTDISIRESRTSIPLYRSIGGFTRLTEKPR